MSATAQPLEERQGRGGYEGILPAPKEVGTADNGGRRGYGDDVPTGSLKPQASVAVPDMAIG